jgi:hypothetical protein
MIQTTNQLWFNYHGLPMFTTWIYQILCMCSQFGPRRDCPWQPSEGATSWSLFNGLQLLQLFFELPRQRRLAQDLGARYGWDMGIRGQDRADRKRESSATANPKLLKPSKRFRKAVLRCPKRHASANYSGLGDKTMTQSIAQSEAPAV